MIYHVLRRIIRISLLVYFKRMVVSGAENIPGHGPLIIVANHPNTFMDPMIIVAITKQRIGFVANAGIFINRFVRSVFSFFHIIPVYRKEDVAQGVKPDNRNSFVRCHEYLERNGTLLIFPEGSSYYELKLREIKSGTARIALGFDSNHDFQSQIKILPVALDYSDSIQFRSIVSVTVCPPVSVSDYRDIYLQDEIQGVRVLTEDIRKALAERIPQTTGKIQEEFLILAHKFYAAYCEPEADLYANPVRSLELRKQLSEALFRISNSHKTIGLYMETQDLVFRYFEELKTINLTTGFFAAQFLNKNKYMVSLGYLIEFILLLPFYIFGLISNYLPYILPSKIYELSGLDIEYKTPLQMVSGLITFPVCYALELWLFRTFINSDLLSSVIFLIMLPVSGYITMYYWTELRRFMRIIRFYFMIPEDSKSRVLDLRNEVLKKMDEARSGLNE